MRKAIDCLYRIFILYEQRKSVIKFWDLDLNTCVSECIKPNK